jgi:hypothetical protein
MSSTERLQAPMLGFGWYRRASSPVTSAEASEAVDIGLGPRTLVARRAGYGSLMMDDLLVSAHDALNHGQHLAPAQAVASDCLSSFARTVEQNRELNALSRLSVQRRLAWQSSFRIPVNSCRRAAKSAASGQESHRD